MAAKKINLKQIDLIKLNIKATNMNQHLKLKLYDDKASYGCLKLSLIINKLSLFVLVYWMVV